MKILVTTTGTTIEANLDPRFGRAAMFALVDTDTGDLEVVQNHQGRNALQGAGIQAAEVAVRLGAKVVITGHCGPKAFSALSAAGIEVVSGANGTVVQALEAYRAGRLKPVSAPDVRGHWG